MKSIISIGVLLLTSALQAQLNIIVSVLPEQTFVRAIGGDKVTIALMVKPGNSPHTYEPKPSQMKDITHANLYLTIGVEFEKHWLPKFRSQNPSMKIVDISNGIAKMSMTQHEQGESATKDPHIWTSPANVKIIAENIYNALAKLDDKNSVYFHNNYKKFLKHIEETDQAIRSTLHNTQGETKFMVFHPAWGYFARDYNLVQLPIEIEGKHPKPKQIVQLIKRARSEHVTALFTSPEFSDQIAKQIALELQIPVTKISPLDPQWSENLKQFAKVIANKQ